MAKQNNLQLYRGQGIPPANSMLEGEIAMDTDRKVLWINNGQTIKPVGIIEGGTTPSADYAGTLWIDNSASPTGIPADFLVANNLTTQAPGDYVLDAYQGKILKDTLDAQQLAISDQADQINNLSEKRAFIDPKYMPACWTLSANTSTTSTEYTLLNYSVKEGNTQPLYATLENSGFTIVEPGWYKICCWGMSQATSSYAFIALYLDSIKAKELYTYGTSWAPFSIQHVVYLSQGQYVSIKWRASSGATAIVAGTIFGAFSLEPLLLD